MLEQNKNLLALSLVWRGTKERTVKVDEIFYSFVVHFNFHYDDDVVFLNKKTEKRDKILIFCQIIGSSCLSMQWQNTKCIKGLFGKMPTKNINNVSENFQLFHVCVKRKLFCLEKTNLHSPVFFCTLYYQVHIPQNT